MDDEIDSLAEADLEYATEFVKEIYNGEIDRKDKILASLNVITAPVTALVAAVAFLFSITFDVKSDYIISEPDIVVVLYFLLFAVMLIFIFLSIYNLHRLLAGENYHYIPDANGVLYNIAEIKKYCTKNEILHDGCVAKFARANFVKQYAESATRNCAANDIRLVYRQGVFRNTILAVIFAAFSFVAVATHRERPHIWDVSALWRHLNGPPAQPVVRPAAAISVSPGDKQPKSIAPESVSPAPAPAPKSHQ